MTDDLRELLRDAGVECRALDEYAEDSESAMYEPIDMVERLDKADAAIRALVKLAIRE